MAAGAFHSSFTMSVIYYTITPHSQLKRTSDATSSSHSLHIFSGQATHHLPRPPSPAKCQLFTTIIAITLLTNGLANWTAQHSKDIQQAV